MKKALILFILILVLGGIILSQCTGEKHSNLSGNYIDYWDGDSVVGDPALSEQLKDVMMTIVAWSSMREFVESLAKGKGNFYDGWMKNPMSAMISCNDGFRPFSFYIEAIE